jgi:hypothetical protein
MFIGDLPKEISDDLENYGSCPAIKYRKGGILNPRWECNLKAVFFGYENNFANSTILDTPALFDTGTNIILAPYLFLVNLQKTYFKNLVENSICFLKQTGNFYGYICAPDPIILDLPQFNFVFGEWVLKMNPNEMFYKYPDQTVRFIISASPTMDQWIFGEPLLKKFHFVFDKDSDVIGFYGKEDKFKSNLPFPDNSINFLIVLIILLSFIILGGFIYLLIWVIKKRNASVTYYDPSMYNKIGNNNSVNATTL